MAGPVRHPLVVAATILAAVVTASVSTLAVVMTVGGAGPASVCGEDHVVFEDRFTGTRLDPARWRAGLYWGPGNANNDEIQIYTGNLDDPDVFEVSSGRLRIRARNDGGTIHSGALTAVHSAAVHDLAAGESGGDQVPVPGQGPTFGPGCYEIRARVPADGPGTWPAFWLATSVGGPAEVTGDPHQRPEIDVFEHLSRRPDEVHVAAHYLDADPAVGRRDQTTNWIRLDEPGRFHTYSVIWADDGIRWFVDGEERHSTSDTAVVPMHLHVNLAIGGWGGPPDDELFADGNRPAVDVDYVRVTSEPGTGYQPRAAGASAGTTGESGATGSSGR